MNNMMEFNRLHFPTRPWCQKVQEKQIDQIQPHSFCEVVLLSFWLNILLLSSSFHIQILTLSFPLPHDPISFHPFHDLNSTHTPH